MVQKKHSNTHSIQRKYTHSRKMGRSWKTLIKQKREIGLHRAQQQESYTGGGEFAIKGASDGMPAYARTASE
jgi:hypothetical protein